MRARAIKLVVFCLCLLLLIVIITAYGNWVVEINAFLVFTSAGIAMLVFWCVGILENKWISLYAKIGQIEQEATGTVYLPFFCARDSQGRL